ncbi:hypothetical protein [Microbacterium sp. PA5]|uniref:hypothetical protein n=1 Tax=Microbacterium sp. PA5 TaxID=3416654 RepID=UPI003CE8072A
MTLTFGPALDTDDLIDEVEEDYGEQGLMRLVDFAVARYQGVGPTRQAPPEVRTLQWHLDANSSAVTVVVRDGLFRLARRLPEGVEEAAQAAVNAGSGSAGEHLARALHAGRGLTPDPSAAMSEAIKAVEAAAGPVVLPNEKRAPQLGKIVAALKDKSGWGLRFRQRDGGHPDHRAVLVGMLETLVFAQTDRHTGRAPTVEEAQSHVLLASTLVEWFSSGTVVMRLAD